MTKEDRRDDLASVMQDVESALEALRTCFPGLYILNGREIVPAANALQWAQWMQTAVERQVAEDFVGNFRVSTIFLGLDHNYLRSGPPILFETMVFGPPVEFKDLRGEIRSVPDSLDYQVRYASFAEAQEGHTVMCDEIRKQLRSSDDIVTQALDKAKK